MLTEPSPLPQPLPTSGSEQIGFLKTINCSCPPGEKVHSPLPAAGLGPQSAVGPELTALAGEVGISHHAHGLPGQDDPGLQVTLGSGTILLLGLLLDVCGPWEGGPSDPTGVNSFLKLMTSFQSLSASWCPRHPCATKQPDLL